MTTAKHSTADDAGFLRMWSASVQEGGSVLDFEVYKTSHEHAFDAWSLRDLLANILELVRAGDYAEAAECAAGFAVMAEGVSDWAAELLEHLDARAAEDGHSPARERLDDAADAALARLGEPSGGHPRAGLRTVEAADVDPATREGDG